MNKSTKPQIIPVPELEQAIKDNMMRWVTLGAKEVATIRHYYDKGLSIRRIGRAMHRSDETVKKALDGVYDA